MTTALSPFLLAQTLLAEQEAKQVEELGRSGQHGATAAG